ncbi:MAG: ABC transporter ATP-binding protein [Thaumarchaeota archaeon]|nr:ABC transporter ATP-binding protein [Nitrososphaerota archaeon]
MADPVVVVEGLSKRYGETRAVDGVSFDVRRGEIFALLGPNGAGKTTTVEILECMRTPTTGTVRVLGKSVTDSAGVDSIKNRIGVLPQDFSALGRLTVGENLEFFAGMFKSHLEVGALLDLLEIKDKKDVRFSNLSGGLKQRVGIAAALVNDPELVFLDEPTTGLDPEIRRATWKVIEGLRSRGKTVILTTHYMEEAQQLADRIAILVKGELAALDTPDALLKQHGVGREMIFTNAEDAVFGTLRRFFDNVSTEGSNVVLPFAETRDVQVALTALAERGLKVDMQIRSATIEDVFLRLAGFRISESGEAK